MLNYIALYPNKYADEFNDEFILGSTDAPIEDLMIACMKEFEAVENIHIEDIKIVRAQDEVDINQHMININFKRKDVDHLDIPKFKYTTKNRFGELILTIRITTNLDERVITKRLLFPIMLEDGTYLNNSKRMKAIWQLVDASTYCQRGKITLKSRMPIIIYHNNHRIIEDVNGEEFSLPSYSYALDTKSKRPGSKKRTKFINPLSIYAAKMGMKKTTKFFGMEGIVYIVGKYEEKELEENYIFPLDNVFVKVDKYLFDKYPLVKAYACMCCNLRCKDFPIEKDLLEDLEYWICRIGYIGSAKSKNLASFHEKGVTTIYMVERLLDNVTIKNLRLPNYYKHSIYYLLYWMITNYDELKKRSNINMANKRVRRNEYIVMSSLGKKISENINKLIEKKSKSKMNTMDTLLELFNFNSDIVVSGMRNLNDLIKTDDIVNDMNFLADLAYSAKGPNSLGKN